MPLILAISGLTAGGAERVLSGLANEWVSRGRQVMLVTWSDPSTDHYPIDRRVERVSLGGAGRSRGLLDAIRANVVRWRRLRKLISIERRRIVISFGESMNVLCILASVGSGGRVVACERNDPRFHDIGGLWSLARRLTYPRASRIVVQTGGVASWAERMVVPSAIRIIPNPARDPGCETSRVPGPAGAPRVLAIGRLVDQKGHDVLLRAFAATTGRAPGWQLSILGDGPLRPDLESLAAQLGLAERVTFHGVVTDPAPMLATSDLFVLSSRYEGFPNALLEAMACGLAVVSTDCPSGPGEIIRRGIDGMLVPVGDVQLLASAMAQLMVDGQERQRLGEEARSVQERFSPERIMALWDAVVAEIAHP